jgi:hypothetical protein
MEKGAFKDVLGVHEQLMLQLVRPPDELMQPVVQQVSYEHQYVREGQRVAQVPQSKPFSTWYMTQDTPRRCRCM